MIGNVPVHDPVVELSAVTKGAMTDKNIAGNIGGEILKRFTVTFDYANQHMYLKPNKNYGAPMNYDRSGMWINGWHGDFVVKYVMAGGFADRAGLKVGDAIIAVNGKPTTTLTLSGLRGMLRNGIPGSRVKLALGKGGRARTVTLMLRRLISRTEALKQAD
jgi:C-terminal processing protease CtpA/Prc